MLKEGYHMSPSGAQEELEEVQSDLRKKEEEVIFYSSIFLHLYFVILNIFSMKKTQIHQAF